MYSERCKRNLSKKCARARSTSAARAAGPPAEKPYLFAAKEMARSDAAAVEPTAGTEADWQRREVASSCQSEPARCFSVHEGAVVVLTIGGLQVHAKIIKVESSGLAGNSKQRRSAKRNTREGFETRQWRRACAARAVAAGVPPGLGLEQQGKQSGATWSNMEQQQEWRAEEVSAPSAASARETKRAAADDAEALAPASRKPRVQGPQCSQEIVPAAGSVVVGRARAARADATPAGKVARRGRWDDAASASVAARERRRQSARDAALGWSGVDEGARYVFM
jgi:hypothetical protein